MSAPRSSLRQFALLVLTAALSSAATFVVLAWIYPERWSSLPALVPDVELDRRQNQPVPDGSSAWHFVPKHSFKRFSAVDLFAVPAPAKGGQGERYLVMRLPGQFSFLDRVSVASVDAGRAEGNELPRDYTYTLRHYVIRTHRGGIAPLPQPNAAYMKMVVPLGARRIHVKFECVGEELTEDEKIAFVPHDRQCPAVEIVLPK
jgi:hypothetical protein